MVKKQIKSNPVQYIHVKVVAGAKKESFTKKSEDHFQILVKERAERNQANTRVIALVAEYFNIPKNKVRIVNGHQSPSKLMVVED